jgi:hypothetical protein
MLTNLAIVVVNLLTVSKILDSIGLQELRYYESFGASIEVSLKTGGTFAIETQI